MIILPTKNRPASLQRFLEAYQNTKATLPVWVVFDRADAHNYNKVETPSHWKRISVPEGMRLGDIFNSIFKKFPEEPYYGMVADDVIPETECWDTILEKACMPNKIAWACDDLQNQNLPVHPFIGGELIRQLGWWAAPGLKHWYVDNVWKMLATALNCEAYLPEVKMPHHHFTNGKASLDRTYEDQPSHAADEVACNLFLRTEFPQIINRIKNASSINAGVIHGSVDNC